MYSVGLLHPWCVRNTVHRNTQDVTALSHLMSCSCSTHPSSGSQLRCSWPVLSVLNYKSSLQKDGQYMTQNVWGVYKIPQNSLGFLSCLLLKTLSSFSEPLYVQDTTALLEIRDHKPSSRSSALSVASPPKNTAFLISQCRKATRNTFLDEVLRDQLLQNPDKG